MQAPHYSPADKLIIGISDTLQVLCAKPLASRAYPATATADQMTAQERRHSAGFMRVNHVGEICAQALYQSQALTASTPQLRQKMQAAATEEIDHLAWCEQRLQELGCRKSYLNPLWYAGAFAIGIVAGLAGDKWNLGFIAETERQVAEHLQAHLDALPQNDPRSKQVVAQMRQDEVAHAEMAIAAGAKQLPKPVAAMMKAASSVMTRTAYWI